MAEDRYVCDACPQDAQIPITGYSQTDLRKDGWQFRALKKKGALPFVMCPKCVKRFEPAWKSKDEAKTAA